MSEHQDGRVFSCGGQPMAALAELVSSILGIRLHAYHSPMIGPWYTSENLSALRQAVESRGSDSASDWNNVTSTDPEISLELNDPEPGYLSPIYPGGAEFVLSIAGSPAVVEDIEHKLRAAGVGIVRRK